MKCLDNIYTKQIKYNSPVLYQLESLKKEYEKLLKVSNEIIKTGSFIEECYFENQSAVLSDNEITFSGNLKIKTDKGNYFQNIPSSLKLNVQGTGEIVVDVGEDNKTLTFKLDEAFLSEISLMIEDLNSLTEKVNSQVFDNFIGIRNTTDSKIDQIKHINNNFQIISNDEKSLLNIDEELEKIYSFSKELAFTDASNLSEENVASWKDKLKVGKLIADYTLASESSSINITGLDLIAHGGVYEIECELKVNTGSDVSVRVNNITETNYDSLIISSYIGRNQAITVSGGINASNFSGGVIQPKGAILSFKLIQNSTSSAEYLFNNFSADTNDSYYRCGGGRVTTTSTVSSIQIMSSQPILQGARIKIYAREK